MDSERNLNDKEIIERNLESITLAQQVDSDGELLHKSDASSLFKHNEQYTLLLKSYVKDYINNSKNKFESKKDFYKIAKWLLIGVTSFTALFMIATLVCLALGIIDVLESLPGLFAILTSLVGTFMVIPKMITKYLFNKKEEDHLAEIISKIQEYDRNIRSDL